MSTPSGACPAVSSTRIARELRGAVQLILAGVAIRVLLCGLGRREVMAAMAEVADLAAFVTIRTEHEAPDTCSVIVGPFRA